MHNQPYVDRIALCTKKKTAKKWRNKGLLRYHHFLELNFLPVLLLVAVLNFDNIET